MLWTILVIILILWLVGFLGHFGGSLVHLLLVIALDRADHSARNRPARGLAAHSVECVRQRHPAR